jgi:hypothetical protein
MTFVTEIRPSWKTLRNEYPIMASGRLQQPKSLNKESLRAPPRKSFVATLYRKLLVYRYNYGA